ncbi:Dyp-type peroxidase [Mucilaginibacter sp. SP1R1]|uniref:Dyp-type peroxidase n=1 Tax=Mucilaginibacter sp. SP1R1 TaxID=2723091 RepID=UPI00161B5157|nr:Dyp-type peroxidase [Mucilaginibacter sp. SP1R1]MBB6149359.1 Dyp-type peroxidase family [Mucilaginibacter sp. SP1R1]
MDTILDLYDIQGNIMKHYPESGFIKARYLFFKVNEGEQGRTFVSEIRRYITSSAHWTTGDDTTTGVAWPDATTNIAFTYNGLKTLGISVQTLQSFPDEFIVGMRGRRSILGDDGPSDPERWDPVWKKEIHIFVSIDAPNDDALVKRFNEILAIITEKKLHNVVLLDGHRADQGEEKAYQDASVLYENDIPTAKEHFGYTDGISNPFFKGMTPEMGELVGGGKKNGINKLGYGDPELASTWAPLETGEFILGHKDEAQEYPLAPMPPLMARNGSFMVYRKLHENVGKFNAYLDEASRNFPGGKELLAAKLVGRWRNGAPITTFPKESEANDIAMKRQLAVYAINQAQTPAQKIAAQATFREVNKKFQAFDYNKDLKGGGCPVGAHIRRANSRGALEFGHNNAFDTPGAVDNRRRLIRRGLPYGKADTPQSNNGNHGTIFMCISANIKRQFEFVLQQWINYGNDFKLANDKDALLGNHAEVNGKGNGRMVLEADGESGNPPYFLSDFPRFIETRGGEYFFIPSLTALRMIGDGIIDPT